MNILIIGNGFDLAHGLPTKYTDFLDFCKMIKKIYTADVNRWSYDVWKEVEIPNRDKNEYLKIMFENMFKNKREQEELRDYPVYIGDPYKIYDEFYKNIKNNMWINYFLQNPIYGKENWIDFESEIESVIESANEDVLKYGLDKVINDSFIFVNSPKYLEVVKILDRERALKITLRELRKELVDCLNKLIRALEIYLSDYVQKMDCKLVSPDIQWILLEKMAINGIQINDAYVLSFNYTNTYQRLYIDGEGENNHFEDCIDYIHGKANIENTIESNNIVLGIDEYLSKKKRNKDTDFIAFKKYYQRIYKGTGSKYKDWVDQIKESWENESGESKAKIRKSISRGDVKNEKIHNVYIFGHSLDVTDKDVLRDLILNDNVYTTIFYHSKDELGRKIANLVKVIGQDELIRRTGGSTKTIEFKQQKHMKEIEN